MQYDKVYDWDVSALPFPQQALFHQTFQKVNYPWQQFHDLVLASLQSYFGASSVTQGNKAIKVRLTSGRTVDVVPALLFRSFRSFYGANQQSYVQGIRFFDQVGRAVVNYPKEHIANGESKNGRTAARYKQTVRMFKNARTCAIDRKLISAACAPSYFVECALYNLLDGYFSSNRQQTFQNVLNYLKSTIPTDKAVCQNGQVLLFGNTPEQWKIDNAAEFVRGLDHLWNNW